MVGSLIFLYSFSLEGRNQRGMISYREMICVLGEDRCLRIYAAPLGASCYGCSFLWHLIKNLSKQIPFCDLENTLYPHNWGPQPKCTWQCRRYGTVGCHTYTLWLDSQHAEQLLIVTAISCSTVENVAASIKCQLSRGRTFPFFYPSSSL
jgi:hypothetical protein